MTPVTDSGGPPATGHRARLAGLAAFAVLAAMVGLVGARTLMNLNVPGRPLEPRYGMQDFRDNAYYPVVAWRDGRNPWDFESYRAHYPVARPLPAYSPLILLVNLPFGLLPYGPAQAAYFATTALLYVVIAYLALLACGARVTPARLFGIAALVTLSRPGHQTLYIGQCTAFVVAGAGLALTRARRHPLAGGLGLALVCVKPTYGLPLALLMAARREGRALLIGLTIAVAGGLVLAAGPARAAGGLVPLLRSVLGGMDVVADDPSFAAASSIIRLDAGGLAGRLLGHSPGPIAEVLIAALILCAAGYALWRCAPAPPARSGPIADGLVALAVLLSMYHQAYDALLLVIPATALVAADDWPAHWRPWRRPLLALLLVPAANFLATNTLQNHLGFQPVARLAIASANGFALLAAFAIWVGLALRRETRGSS